MSRLNDRPGRGLLRRAVWLTVLTGAAAAAAGAVARGGDGALGAAAGGALVLAFLLVGQVPVSQAARGRRWLAAGLLIVLYVVRVLALVAAYGLLLGPAQDVVDATVLGLTVLACALAWTSGVVWSAVRWRPVLVEPDPHVAPPRRVDPR